MERSVNEKKDHEAEHTGIRCEPCEFCDLQKGAKNDMNDHVVSEHVISEDYVTSGCSENKSKVQLKVPVLNYPTLKF